MSLDKINIRTWVILFVIIGFAALRGLSPERFGEWANFTPVGAIALFGGVYFKKNWQAFCLPLLILLISDAFINYGYFGKFTLIYEGIFWVYLSFALIVLLSRFIKNVKPASIFLSAIAAVLIHWIVADIGVWLNNPAFAQTPAGFIQCLTLAIPFEKNFLAGTLLYSAVMFGGFEILKSYVPKLSLVKL
jgi:hypothetical protein